MYTAASDRALAAGDRSFADGRPYATRERGLTQAADRRENEVSTGRPRRRTHETHRRLDTAHGAPAAPARRVTWTAGPETVGAHCAPGAPEPSGCQPSRTDGSKWTDVLAQGIASAFPALPQPGQQALQG